MQDCCKIEPILVGSLSTVTTWEHRALVKNFIYLAKKLRSWVAHVNQKDRLGSCRHKISIESMPESKPSTCKKPSSELRTYTANRQHFSKLNFRKLHPGCKTPILPLRHRKAIVTWPGGLRSSDRPCPATVGAWHQNT